LYSNVHPVKGCQWARSIHYFRFARLNEAARRRTLRVRRMEQ
jgi:hypothetical protein